MRREGSPSGVGPVVNVSALAVTVILLFTAGRATAGDLYWDGNGVTAGVGGPSSGNVSWLGGGNWSTSTAGTDAAPWGNGNNAFFTNLTTAGFTVNSTAANPISVTSLNFYGDTTGTSPSRSYTLLAGPSSPGITFAGASPNITLQNGSTAFIYSNLTSANKLTVTKGLPGGIVLNLYGANSFDGGIEITNNMRVNFNADGAAGVAGHAGAITVDSTDTVLSSVGSLPLAFNQTFRVLNNISLNPNYDPQNPLAFRTSLSATAASPAVLTMDFAGQISGHGDVVISNDVFSKGGGAGRSMFSNHLNDFVGSVYIANTGTTGAFILGNDEVIPDTSDVIFGINTAGKQHGPIDMNGHSETVASISTNFGTGTSALGITNTSSNLSTLSIGGMTAKTYTYDSTIGAASNTTPGNVVGNNNVALVLTSGNNAAGVLSLTKASTYTGGTTINGGVLLLGTGGSISSVGNLTLNGGGTFDLGAKSQQIGVLAGTGGKIQSTGGAGTLTVNFNNASSTFAGVISGAVALNKGGTGVLSLEGANTYSGATTVSRGTLLINNGSGASASAIGVNSNATLGGIGKAGGAVTVNSGGILAPGKVTAGALAGTFTASGLTLNPNATLRFDLDTPAGTNDKVVVTGGLTLIDSATPINIDINNLGGLGAGVYHLLTYGTTLTGSFADLNLHSFPTTFGYALLNNAGSVDLQVSALNAAKTWVGNTADFNTGTNFSASGVPGAADPVVFNDSATSKTVTLSAAVAPGPITFNNNTTDYTVGGAAITGTVPLTKNGNGKLTLTGANTFSGPIAINGGTLSVSSNANLGSAFNGIVLSNATLEATGTFAANRGVTLSGPGTFSVTPGNVLTWDGVIGGSSNLTIAGGGTVVLSNIDNSYVGSTTIATGTTLTLAASDVIPDTSAVNLATGATLNLATFNETVGSISGAGIITVGTGRVLTAGGDDSSTSFTGVIGGAGSLAKNGAGTLTLGNANTFGGAGAAVTVNAGTLGVSADGNLGNASNVVNIVDGATLSVDAAAAAFSSARTINLAGRAVGVFSTISVTGANGATLSGKVGGSSGQIAGLMKTGNGALTLANATNNFAGLSIAGGTVLAASDGALGAGDLTLTGGTLKLTAPITTAKSLSASVGFGGAIDTGANAVTISGLISGPQNAPITKLGSGRLLLTTPSLTVATAFGGAWNILEGTVAVNAVTPGGGGQGIPPQGVSAVGVGGSTTATLFSNSITVRGSGTFEIAGVDLGQSAIGTSLAPRIYLDNGGSLLASGNATTGTASYGRSDGALYVIRGANAASPSVVSLKTAAAGAITSPVFTLADPILQQENPALQPYPAGAGDGGNAIIQVSGPGRIVLRGGNRGAPTSLNKRVLSAQNFGGSWDVQSGILQLGPVIPNTQADGFSADPLEEPLNALGFANNDPAQANPVLLSGGTLAVGVDAYNANPNITDQYANTADPSINWVRNPITLKGGAVASTGFEVSYGAGTDDPQGVPTSVPVTAHLGGSFTVAAGAAHSKILTYDPVTPTLARTVELVGNAPTTWVGILDIEPLGTTGGAFNIARTGGAVSVTAGATIIVKAGATLRLNGAGALYDGVRGVNVQNDSTTNVETGDHALGNLDGTGNTTVSPGATLTADRVRQNAVTVGAGAKVTVRGGGGAGGASVIAALNLAGTPAAPTATLDLNDHDLILKTLSEANVRSLLHAGRGTGMWDGGVGITSSTAATDGKMGIGYLQNGTVGTPTVTTFDDQVGLTGGEVLLKYTLSGDADLNGKVDFDDLVTLAQHYDTSNGSATWRTGDFDYDGNVGFEDLVKVAQNYDAKLPWSAVPGATADFQGDVAAAFASVPEPSAAAMLLGATCGLLLRRRRAANE